MSHVLARRMAVILFVFAIMLGACTRPWGGEQTSLTLTPKPTSTPLPEPTVTTTPTPTPTNTPTPTQTPTPTITPTPTLAAHGPDNFPANVNPLTGMVVEDTALLARRPIAVKVSNFPRSLRPHTGLSFADMVFEYYIGAGATRFVAIYYGANSEQVGPVRSARLIDASLVSAYQGILGFVSADAFVYQRVINTLGDRAITESSQTCPAICRTGNGDVNSVFANTQELTKFAEEERNIDNSAPNLDGMAFDPEAPADGVSGSGLQVQYSSYAISEWRYDATSEKYLRWIETLDAANEVSMEILVDRLTGEQLAFDNVVVLFAHHDEIKPTLHEMEILGNTQGQRAILFRNGQMYELIWKAVAPDRPLQFFLPDGTPMAFKPGKTWFEVVGLNSAVSELEAGQWHVHFYQP